VAATIDEIRRIVRLLGDSLLDVRDRALLLVGYAGAMRRSELVALNVDDVNILEAGIEVTIRRSKTDQEGVGCTLEVPFGRHVGTCPVRALKAWLDRSGITSGPIFRSADHNVVAEVRLSPQSVALIVKRRCRAAGLDDTIFSGHSLRAGFATTAVRSGEISERAVMQHTRHKSERVFAGYVREARRWSKPVAGFVGL
jgi:integrase